MRKKVNKKLIVALLSFVLLFGGTFGSSLAWLLDNTTPVENTFTPSKIDVELEESENLDLKMIPGWTVEKDPQVTVTSASEACYVFVKIEKSSNYDTYLEDYAGAVDTSVWQLLEDSDANDNIKVSDTYYSVYYHKVEDTSNGWSAYVLKGADHLENCEETDDCECPNLNGYVTVKGTVTKTEMELIDEESEKSARPTLSFTAYASQLMKSESEEFSAYEAWKNVAP